jgi:ketosteroid isomerase-like protein
VSERPSPWAPAAGTARDARGAPAWKRCPSELRGARPAAEGRFNREIAACAQYFADCSAPAPAHIEVHAVHITSDAAVEESTSTGAHHGVLHSPAGDVPPTGRDVTVDYIQVLRFRDGRHT